jgi:hypothetical protein
MRSVRDARLRALRLGSALAAAFICTAPARADSSEAPSRSEEDSIAAFSDPALVWGRGIEATIEKAYRECFRTLPLGGRIRTLRLPFAENSERSELAGKDLEVRGGGKADPSELWDAIGQALASADFSSYLGALSSGREQLVNFDIALRSWSTSEDRFAIERLLSGRYPGLPHRPAVLSSGQGATDADVYNYLYCVGRLGIDCSGFVWHVLRAVASSGGLDLDKSLGRSVGLPKGARPSLYVGTWYYDPRGGRTRAIPDEIGKLLPGDIILFRGEDGSFIHSCVIQSVDLEAGRLRYLQSTDESPLDERGVHDSIILFDPARPEASLRDGSLQWLQRRGAAFAGELPPAFRDDGERYRAYPELGGGVVVRLKALEKTVQRLRAQGAAARP